jgi:hypothetical protein
MKGFASPLVLILGAAAALGLLVGVLTIPRAALEGPSPTPTATTAASTAATSPSGPRAHVYVVAEGRPPLRVESTYPLIEGTLLTRVASRIDGLRATSLPAGYVNPYLTSTARLERVTHDEPSVISLWFVVRDDDWGVPADQAKLLLQQLVWTTTEEPGIELVRIWQNQGRKGGANVAGTPANYEMTRKTFP